jgi:RNA recognition motif-containing protein
MPKVYVGNLASSVTSSDLSTHFARAGEVVGALAVKDRESGQCRGFGFVEMAKIADVALAISLLNNSLLNGQQIKIEPDPLLSNGKSRSRGVRDLHRDGPKEV